MKITIFTRVIQGLKGKSTENVINKIERHLEIINNLSDTGSPKFFKKFFKRKFKST